MTAEHPQRQDWILRTAAWIGDLGNPFYGEERQRDVWNEASSVGLQVAIWLGLTAATVMVWAGGRTGLPYALGLLGVVLASSLLTIVYAARLGVHVDDPARMSRLRLLPLAVLLVVLVVGLARAGDWSMGFQWGFGIGAIGGGVLYLVLALVRRRTVD
jgi:hypothetical protein